MDLGHMLTRSSLTQLEVSFMVFPGFFRLFSVVFSTVGNLTIVKVNLVF
jgi:hypothetical protein